MAKKRYKKAEREKFERIINLYIKNNAHYKDKRVASDAVEPRPYLKTKYGTDYEVRHIEADDDCLELMGAFEGGKDIYAVIRADGIDCNPFTGKWNFHFFGDDVDTVINHITKWLDIIQGKPATVF